MKEIVENRLKEIEKSLKGLEALVEKDKRESKDRIATMFNSINEVAKLRVERDALKDLIEKDSAKE